MRLRALQDPDKYQGEAPQALSDATSITMRHFDRNTSWFCVNGKVHVGLWSLKVLPAHAFIPVTPGVSVSYQLPTSSHSHLPPPPADSSPSFPPTSACPPHPFPALHPELCCLEMHTHRRPMIILCLQGSLRHSSHPEPPSLIWTNLGPDHTTCFLFLPSGYRSRQRGCRVSSQNTKHCRALVTSAPVIRSSQLSSQLSCLAFGSCGFPVAFLPHSSCFKHFHPPRAPRSHQLPHRLHG